MDHVGNANKKTHPIENNNKRCVHLTNLDGGEEMGLIPPPKKILCS